MPRRGNEISRSNREETASSSETNDHLLDLYREHGESRASRDDGIDRSGWMICQHLDEVIHQTQRIIDQQGSAQGKRANEIIGRYEQEHENNPKPEKESVYIDKINNLHAYFNQDKGKWKQLDQTTQQQTLDHINKLEATIPKSGN